VVLTVYLVLSPAIGLFVTVVSAMRKHCRQLDISVEISGPYDFAVRPARVRLCTPKASTASRPAFVTIASRPSDRGGTGESIKLFLPNGEAKYFLKEGWTTA
jgi:hypothetical protein